MNKYIVSIWPGVGYYTTQIEVRAFCEDEALEAAMAYCQQNELTGLYTDLDELEHMKLSEQEEEELYIYIDPTCCKSECNPAYFYVENLGICRVA